MKKVEQVEEQILQQKGVIFNKPFSVPVKKEKKKKVNRKERNFRKIIEISKNNPSFFEEINSHSIQRNIWRAKSRFMILYRSFG